MAASTVSPPSTTLHLGDAPSTQLLATASMSNYAHERHYAERHPTWHKAQICEVPAQSAGLPESRGVQNTMDRAWESPLPMSKEVGDDTYASPRERLRRRVPDPAAEKAQQTLADYQAQQLTLHYLAYFEEDVTGSALERHRARVVRLDVFVEDGSLRVFEPEVDNCGLEQGLILRRHKAVDDAGVPVTPATLAVGGAVTLYGTTYHVVDADERTRAWVADMHGKTLAAALPVPPTYTPPSTKREHRVRPTTVVYDVGYQENPFLGFYSRSGDTRGQFQAHAGQVLRFEAEWSAGAHAGPLADARTLVLQYYLADDTLELIEPPYHNSGRGEFVKVLARQRLPVIAVGVHGGDASGGTGSRLGFLAPEEAALEVTATLAAKRMAQRYRCSTGSDARYHHTSPITGAPTFTAEGAAEDGGATYVTAAQLVCGRVLSVYGKPLRLRRCDPWTSRWYAANLGVDQTATFAEAPRGAGSAPLLPPGKRYAAAPPPVPAHVGALAIGDEGETRRNAFKLIPTYASTKDMEQGYRQAGKVLRFRAKLVTEHPVEVERRFVLAYHLEDDTAGVFEVAGANSGLRRGKFLDRGSYRVLQAEDAAGELASTRQLAAERRFGTVGYLMGYEHGFGQGYAGGPLGREDRVGPGGTGVSLARGVGVHVDTVTTLAAAAAQGHPLRPQHLGTGSTLTFAHAPAQTFELLEPDAFTAKLLGLPEAEEAAPTEAEEGALTLAYRAVLGVLAGCMESARTVCKQADYSGSGAVHPSALRRALRLYGALPPMVSQEHLDAVVAAHVIAVDAEDAGAVSPALVGKVDYGALFAALDGAQEALQAKAQSDDKLLGQLRYALLSSRAHLRAVFRELGLQVPNAITPTEFRGLLRRHNLDLGMDEPQLLAAMAPFPPAEPDAAAAAALPAGSISLRGFVERLVDAHSLPPAAVDDFLVVVMGVRAPLAGAGMAPEVHTHVNKQALWDETDAQWGVAPPAPPAGEAAGSPLDTSAVSVGAGGGDPGACAGSPSKLPSSRRSSPREEAASAAPSPAKDPRTRASADTLADAGELMARMGEFFQFRKVELRRVLALYDPTKVGAMRLPSLVSALESAGFHLTPRETDALTRGLAPATDSEGLLDYREFAAQLFS